jgi:hypothetical protein
MCDMRLRQAPEQAQKTRSRAPCGPLGGLALAVVLLGGGCAGSSAQVKDPDQDAVCRAADGEGVVLVRCGRFAMALVDVDPTLPDEAVVKVYRSVVDDEVGVAVVVQQAPLEVGGRTLAGFAWETPDHVAPRSGRVLTGEVDGKRRVITCEVRDAGKTAVARCEERLRGLLIDGHQALPRVSVAELSKVPPSDAP